jgi:hypothetical protein
MLKDLHVVKSEKPSNLKNNNLPLTVKSQVTEFNVEKFNNVVEVCSDMDSVKMIEFGGNECFPSS